MTTLLQYAVAGVAGLLALGLAGGLVLSLLGLAAALIGLALKIAVVLFVGWLVLRVLRGRRPGKA